MAANLAAPIPFVKHVALPVTDKIERPKDKGDTSHLEDEMPPRRTETDEIFELREAVHNITLAVQSLVNVKPSQVDVSNSNAMARSTDTLRRDIGIFAILLGMMVQTGAAFYWAGGVSRAQETSKETMQAMQQEQAYTRAQLQLIDGQLKLIQGKQEAEHSNGKNRR